MEPIMTNDESQRTPFQEGVYWVASSWDLFATKPGFWILFGLVSIVLTAGVSIIPIAGSIIGFIISPVLSGGYALSATLQEHGRELKFSHFFLGFQQRFDQLVMIGAFKFLLTLGILVIAATLTAGAMILAGVMNLSTSSSGFLESLNSGGSRIASTPEGTSVMIVLGCILLASCLLLGVFVTMMGWFAPALVVLKDMQAWPAMKESLRACLNHGASMFGYGMALFGVGILTLTTLGAGLLIALPMVQLSVYSAYKSLFSQRKPPAPALADA